MYSQSNSKKMLSLVLGIIIILTSMFGTVPVVAEDPQTVVASFTGTNTVTEWDINNDGLTITIGLNQGYSFVDNVEDYKNAIIDGLIFNASLFNKTTCQYEPVSLETFITSELNLYGSAGYFPYLDQSNGITVYDRFVGLNPQGARSIATVNEETKAAYPGVKQGIISALKTGATVSVNEDGNLVITCTKDDANGYFSTFTNAVPVVNGGIQIANCDILLSANLPVGIINNVSEIVSVSNYFSIQEMKLHTEVWEYVDASHKDEAGVYAFNTRVAAPTNTGAYGTTYYVKRVEGDVLTEADIRSGGTMGPNGTGNKLIKVMVDNRVGPTQWADAKNTATFFTNLFRTSKDATGYSGNNATTYTPSDDLQWLKVENQILNGGTNPSLPYNVSTNKYAVNYSGNNRMDTTNPAAMWIFYELPRTADFNITSDVPVYVNLIGGFVGGSGQSVSQSGQPILGMDGRFSFTIDEADMEAYNAALSAVAESDYIADSWNAYQEVVAANNMDAQLNTWEEINAATAAIIAAQAQLVPTAPTGLVAEAPIQYGLSNGKITGTSVGMEYKLSTDETYTTVTGTSINGLVAGTYNVRYAANSEFNASAVANVTVPDGPNQDQTAPTGLVAETPTQYGLSDGKITGTVVGMEYKLSTATSYLPVTGVTIEGLTVGTYNVRYAAKEGYNASAVTTVTVLDGPNYNQSAPTGTGAVAPTHFGLLDGKITGTTVGMEYKLSTDVSYTAVTGSTIEGLAPGTYNLRFSAKEGYNASASTTITVPAATNGIDGKMASVTGCAYTGTGTTLNPYHIAINSGDFTAPSKFWGDENMNVANFAVSFERFVGNTITGSLISSCTFDLSKNATSAWDNTWEYAFRFPTWTEFDTSTGNLRIAFPYKGSFSTYWKDWNYKFDAVGQTAGLAADKQLKSGDTVKITYYGNYISTETSRGVNYTIDFNKYDQNASATYYATVDSNGYVTFCGENAIAYGGNYLVEKVPVSGEVLIKAENNATSINTKDGTLKLNAVVYPTTLNQAIVWEIVDGTSFASIDENGLLKAIADGQVTVRAYGNANKTIYSDYVVNITSQTMATFTSENVGLSATGYIPAGYELVAEKIASNDNDYKIISQNVKSGSVILGCYDIHFENNGNIVDLNQPITLTFDVGSQYNGYTAVIYHNHNGEIIEYKTFVKDGKAVIVVNNFSNFLVTISNNNGSTVNSVIPGTGDHTPIVLYISFMLMTVVVVGSFSLKKIRKIKYGNKI